MTPRDYDKARAAADKQLQRNGYRSLPACNNCKHSEHGYEGEVNCSLVSVAWYEDGSGGTIEPDVEPNGICDKYTPHSEDSPHA